MNLLFPARPRRRTSPRAGYSLVELMIYLVVLLAILGVGGNALGRLWTASFHLRRQTDDLRSALAAGERWREDIRHTAGSIREDRAGNDLVLALPQGDGTVVQWAFAGAQVQRRSSPTNSWTRLLGNVKASTVQTDPRNGVAAWRWELELAPLTAKSRFERRFAFLAVAGHAASP